MNTREVNNKILEISNLVMEDIINKEMDTISFYYDKGYKLNVQDIILLIQGHIIGDFTLYFTTDLYTLYSSLYWLVLEYIHDYKYELDYIKTQIK